MRSARLALTATLAVALLAAPVIAQDGTTTPDLLPGVDLLTEEVEPGVYRVVSDGVRDLESEATIDRVGDMRLIGTHHSIAAGLDGSVWSFGPDAFYRLGNEGFIVPTDVVPPVPEGASTN
jgi:hypothetical protein